MSKLSLITLGIAFLLVLGSATIIAQKSTKKKTAEKLKKIESPVEKIIIQTGDGEQVFEGYEAEYLFKKLKKHKEEYGIAMLKGPKTFWIDGDSSKVIKEIVGFEDDNSVLVLEDDDLVYELLIDKIAEADSLIKEINVKNRNGTLTLEITTIENGEEKTKIFEGEDANDKLKELRKVQVKRLGNDGKLHFKKLSRNRVKWFGPNDHLIMLDDDPNRTLIEISVENTDDDLKVLVEEKDGDSSKITKYEGEEAEKFLKRNDHENIFIERLGDDDYSIVVAKIKSRGDRAEVFEWIDKNGEDKITKKVKYTEEDGEKKLTIKKYDKDGEETVETFTGKEAKSKFKEMKNELETK